MTRVKTPEEILVGAGVIGAGQAAEARKLLAENRLPESHFPQAVVELGFAQRARVLEALSRAWGLPSVDLKASPPDPALLGSSRPFGNLLPFATCRKKSLAPLYADDSVLILACAQPLDPVALDDLRQSTGLDVQPRLALAGDVARLIDSIDPERVPMGPGTDLGSIIKKLVAEGRIEEAGELMGSGYKGPTVSQILLESDPPVLRLSPGQLRQAAKAVYDLKVDFIEAVIRLKFASKEALLGALSKAWAVPYVDLEKENVSLDTVRRLRTPEFIWDSVLAFDERDGALCLAMKDPHNRLLIEHIEGLAGKKVRPFLALAGEIREVLARLSS